MSNIERETIKPTNLFRIELSEKDEERNGMREKE